MYMPCLARDKATFILLELLEIPRSSALDKRNNTATYFQKANRGRLALLERAGISNQRYNHNLSLLPLEGVYRSNADLQIS